MVENRREITPGELEEARRTGNRAILDNIKIKASVVVRRANGEIKYDNSDNVGKYHEENLNDS